MSETPAITSSNPTTWLQDIVLAKNAFINQYTVPWHTEEGALSASEFVSNMHGVTQIASYLWPAAATSAAAHEVMKAHYAAGDRLSLPM